MKSEVNVLYPNDAVSEKVLNYAKEKSLGLPKHLVDYHTWICDTRGDANYTISLLQAKSLVWQARTIGAKRVLEIGVYLGFSSLVWGHAVGPEGKVTGLEFEAEYAKQARDAYKANGLENIEVIEGDGLKTLAELSPSEPYDLIFIDAQKSGYPEYLATILRKSQPGQANRLLRPGGLIIADNVLRRGLVADDSEANPAAQRQQAERSHYAQDKDLEAIREFNTKLNDNPRLEAFLLPLFDGLGFGRLLD